MKQNDEKGQSRREFMRLAAIVAGGVAIGAGGYIAYQKTRPDALSRGGIPRLNLAFRIKEISPQEIELYTHLANGEVLKHRFKGLEADLFREIVREQELEPLIVGLAQKHNLPVKECREKISQLLKEFEQAKLVYYGEKMLVKIVEVENAQ